MQRALTPSLKDVAANGARQMAGGFVAPVLNPPAGGMASGVVSGPNPGQITVHGPPTPQSITVGVGVPFARLLQQQAELPCPIGHGRGLMNWHSSDENSGRSQAVGKLMGACWSD